MPHVCPGSDGTFQQNVTVDALRAVFETEAANRLAAAMRIQGVRTLSIDNGRTMTIGDNAIALGVFGCCEHDRLGRHITAVEAGAIERLSRAAGRAEAEPTVRKAIRAAWSEIHHPVEGLGTGPQSPQMGLAFQRWADSEGMDGRWPGDLPPILQRRYQTPADIAASLRRAAQ